MKHLSITLTLFILLTISTIASPIKMALIINAGTGNINTSIECELINSELVKANYLVWQPQAKLKTLELKAVIDNFTQKATKANAEILIYYAGHGFYKNGATFLSTFDGYIALNYIYQRISSLKTPKILFINACRNIPENIRIMSHNKIIEHLPENTFTLFSSAPSKTAPNDNEFAQLLTKAISMQMNLNEIAIYVQQNKYCCLSPETQSTMKQKYFINQLNY